MVTVKVSLGEDIRCFRLFTLLFSALQCKLEEIFGQAIQGSFDVKYMDHEGDQITASNDSDLNFAIHLAPQAADEKFLRLYLIPNRVSQANSAPVQAPTCSTYIHAAPMKDVDISRPGIILHSARYGALGHWKDVRRKFEEHCIVGEQVVIKRSLNDLFGDHLHGTVKRVEAMVEIRGVITPILVSENCTLVFPPTVSQDFRAKHYGGNRIFWQGVGDQSMLEYPIELSQISQLAGLIRDRCEDPNEKAEELRKTLVHYVEWGTSLAKVFHPDGGLFLDTHHAALLTKIFPVMGSVIVDFFGNKGEAFWAAMDALHLHHTEQKYGSTHTEGLIGYWRNSIAHGNSSCNETKQDQVEMPVAIRPSKSAKISEGEDTLDIFNSLRKVIFVMILACKEALESSQSSSESLRA